MNIEDHYFGICDAPDITGVLVFLAVAYGNYGFEGRKREEPYYKRKDKRLWKRQSM